LTGSFFCFLWIHCLLHPSMSLISTNLPDGSDVALDILKIRLRNSNYVSSTDVSFHLQDGELAYTWTDTLAFITLEYSISTASSSERHQKSWLRLRLASHFILSIPITPSTDRYYQLRSAKVNGKVVDEQTKTRWPGGSTLAQSPNEVPLVRKCTAMALWMLRGACSGDTANSVNSLRLATKRRRQSCSKCTNPVWLIESQYRVNRESVERQ
jgi:hypothetical protein